MDFRYITGICCIYIYISLFLGDMQLFVSLLKETGFRLMQPLQTPPAFCLSPHSPVEWQYAASIRTVYMSYTFPLKSDME